MFVAISASCLLFFFQLDDRALDYVMKKLFKSYKMWCKYLGRKSSLW
jgi:callose synthase